MRVWVKIQSGRNSRVQTDFLNYENRKQKRCGVIWITGLSGSGKSTIANELAELLKNQDYSVILLDGDNLRYVYSSEIETNPYSIDSRLHLALQYSKLCEVIASDDMIVIIATVSLFSEIHKRNRNNIEGYVEVFLDTPLSELEKRDPKGLYSDFKSGKQINVAGLDLKVDLPKDPDLCIQTVRASANKLAKELFEWIIKNYSLPS